MRYALNEAAINAYKTWPGSGLTTLELESSASGTVQVLGSGTSTLELETSANGTVIVFGAGSSLMELMSSATGATAVLGGGSSEMVLESAHGMPDPHVLPSQFYDTHPSRRIIVSRDNDGFVVADESRTVRVAREDRTVIVAPERDT